AVLGIFFGVFLAIVSAASTRMRCPLPLAIRSLRLALGVVMVCWVTGGIVGLVLAHVMPSLWGFFFIGVPPRVNLPRFAWVGGSIWGAYAGAMLALLAASIDLHVRWRRMTRTAHGFAIVVPADSSTDAGAIAPDSSHSSV